jgi:hypothetical protein
VRLKNGLPSLKALKESPLSQTKSPELHVGSNVYTIDGEKVGRLRFIMVDPDTASISHLVLEKSSFLEKDVMVPTDRVGQVLHRGIFLTANIGELVDMEDFPESEYGSRERGERSDNNNRGRRGKRYRRHRNND